MADNRPLGLKLDQATLKKWLPVLVAVLLVGGVFWVGQNWSSWGNKGLQSVAYDGYAPRGGQESLAGGSSGGSGQYELDVRTAYAQVDSRDAESDAAAMEAKSEELGGYTESSSTTEGETTITKRLVLRVPVENLDEFLGWLGANYDLDSETLSNYKVNIELDTSLLQIYNQSLQVYGELLEQAREQEASADTIEAIASIVEQMAYAQTRLEYAAYQLGEQVKDAEMSQVTLSLVQTKPVQVLPEKYGRTLVLKVKDALDSLLGVVADAVIYLPVFLVKLLKWLVYGGLILIIARPIWTWAKHKLQVP